MCKVGTLWLSLGPRPCSRGCPVLTPAPDVFNFPFGLQRIPASKGGVIRVGPQGNLPFGHPQSSD